MPSKYLSEDEALIGVSAALLRLIEKGGSLSVLWDEAKKIDTVGNFERFTLALDLLYILGIVDFRNNEVVRVQI